MVDGQVCVDTGTGELLPIIRDQKSIEGFDPGWTGLHVVSGLVPIYVLALRHDDGREASWFLDATMHHIGGGLQQAVNVEYPGLKSQIVRLLKQTINRVNAARPEIDADEEPDYDLSLLCDRTIFDLIDVAWSDLFGRTAILNLDDPATTSALAAFRLSKADLLATLNGYLPDAFAQMLRTGTFNRPSPFGIGSASADIGLLIESRLTAYRFIDERSGRAFYLITHGYHDRTCAVYFPGADLYCFTGPSPEFRHFSFLYVLHIIRHTNGILRYLRQSDQPKKIVNFVSDFPTLHLGHVVWNELSGVLDIVQKVGRDKLPDIYVLNAAIGSEPFGKIDDLFPEYHGKIIRPSFEWRSAAAYLYENRLFFVRYMIRYVRRDVGRRILDQVSSNRFLDEDRSLLQRFTQERRPVVLLGLRVGNRTVPGLEHLYGDVIDHLIDRLGRITIIIEGHNARIVGDPSTSFSSFGPADVEEPLIDELRIVFVLRKRFQRNKNIEIVSVVGTSIARSLFWISACHFFVAPWGASLAKYRWICNKPGFVMTNRFNIGEPTGDLLIYNSPEFMEDPAPMEIIDLQHVQDAPGASAGFYSNFVPSLSAVLEGVDRLIKFVKLQ